MVQPPDLINDEKSREDIYPMWLPWGGVQIMGSSDPKFTCRALTWALGLNRGRPGARGVHNKAILVRVLLAHPGSEGICLFFTRWSLLFQGSTLLVWVITLLGGNCLPVRFVTYIWVWDCLEIHQSTKNNLSKVASYYILACWGYSIWHLGFPGCSIKS